MMAIRGDTHTYKTSSTIVSLRQKLSSSQLQNKGALASSECFLFLLENVFDVCFNVEAELPELCQVQVGFKMESC